MTQPVILADAAVRLEAVVRQHLPHLSRRLVRALIADGHVLLNGRPATKGLRVAVGDAIVLPELAAHLTPEPLAKLVILHEDEALLAMDKPGGVPGHALAPWERGTLAAALLARYPEVGGIGDALAPGLVHRLDIGTSGVLLAARTLPAFTALRAALRGRRVEKTYLALVVGTPRPQAIETALMHDPGDRRRMSAAIAGRRSWEARTEIKSMAAAAGWTLVEARMQTGVTHQVRAHLALAGHPVVGDTLYGGPEVDLPPARFALHAAAVRFPHPAGRGPCEIASRFPADLVALAPWSATTD